MLRDQLNEAMKTAMRARDTAALGTIRLILAKLKDVDIAARTGTSREGVADDRRGRVPLLDAARDLLSRQHIVERIIERPEIGIDLLAQIAGQEAEPLAGLDRRARQDDAIDFLAFE